jgi:CDP-diacylglycerol--glycerol-3-phosphate 3-phosphatidyltransferase
MSVLFLEQKMVGWEMIAMLSRDLSLCLYGLWIVAKGNWKRVVFHAIRWGKVTTALQFIVLIGLVLGYSFPWYVYGSFIVMGALAFLELFQIRTKEV